MKGETRVAELRETHFGADYIRALEDEVERLRAALKHAIVLLAQTFEDESVWDLYWAKSKEAAPLREALKEEGK